MIIEFDSELIKKCQKNAPRYTSYPTADRFTIEYNYKKHLLNIETYKNNILNDPISLYIHIPFCNTLCLFCGCNKIITNNKSSIKKYLVYLKKEIDLYMNLINKKLDLIQLHFGGGSPSWVDIDDLESLMIFLKNNFNFDKIKEVSIEIDPRHCSKEYIRQIKRLGFNRISLGVQDFDLKVQKAVNRIQTLDETKDIIDMAKELSFDSINIDLIYGLPFQTLSSFEQTIDKVITLKPDRIALFNFAHIPSIFMPQTRLNENDLPTADEKLKILQFSVTKLNSSGYWFIGMDHFALPTDELAIAALNKTLQRNFQGYSTFSDTAMISFGLSSIGYLINNYYQNVKDLNTYYTMLDNNVLPILRGVDLTYDDKIRKYVIEQIMCQYYLNYSKLNEKFNFNFKEYFNKELSNIEELQKLELVILSNDELIVTNKGKFLIRNIASVFDYYLNQDVVTKRYSKSI